MANTNLNHLKILTGGDEESFRELVELFIEQVPVLIQNMNRYCSEGRYDALGREAHNAKSSLQIMGMEEMEAEMKILQHKALSSIDPESYSRHIRNFEIQCLAAVEELKIMLSKLP